MDQLVSVDVNHYHHRILGNKTNNKGNIETCVSQLQKAIN
jgi:hypothetical protein